MARAVRASTRVEPGVLVVDDEPVNLAVSRGALAREGFRVLEASGAREALRLFVRERPDVVVTDLSMPDMSGLELRRANDAWRRLGTLGPALRAEVAEEVAAAMHGARPAACDLRRAVSGGAAGERRYFELSVLPLAGGRALLVAQDLTEKTRLEEELVQAEKLSSLGMLAGGIVHDLASPLSAIVGMAQLLHQDLGPRHDEKVEAIAGAARYMHGVCLELGEFTRRARPGARELVDVNETCLKALSLARYAQ